MTDAAPLLEVRSVSKRFGRIQALNSVSISLYPGEVLGLAGDNGAGKSTLVKIIAGVYRPDGGEIRYMGTPRTFETPGEARAAGIETIHQDLALAGNLDVGSNIFLGREPVRRWMGIRILDRRKMEDAARAAARALGIRIERFDMPVRNLSGGQRQAVAIGRAIHWDARIIIMDEPTAALGVAEQHKLMSLIQTLRDQGRGIIFISHHLGDIFAVADRIAVLRRGVLTGEREKSATSPDEIVRLMVGGRL
jgi:simple sugar transport system ATP-binding protein